MPRYDYRCTSCAKLFEVSHGINDDRGVCGNCGGQLGRVYTKGSAPSFKFVGQGFHSNDYKNSNYDTMTHNQREDYDKRAADDYDAKHEAGEKDYQQNIKDITGS